MKILAAMYHSEDKEDEAYWDIPKTAKQYNIQITDMNKSDWGGETVFQLEGTYEDLVHFAVEFCDAEKIEDLYPTNKQGE